MDRTKGKKDLPFALMERNILGYDLIVHFLLGTMALWSFCCIFEYTYDCEEIKIICEPSYFVLCFVTATDRMYTWYIDKYNFSYQCEEYDSEISARCHHTHW